MSFNAENEYGKLKSVLLASIDLPKSLKGRKIITLGNESLADDLKNGQADLVKLLNKQGIESKVIQSHDLLGLTMGFARDPFFVVGDKLVVKEHIDPKKRENAKRLLIKQLDVENKDDVLYVSGDTGAKIDGGDVVLHNGTIYVGQNGLGSTKEGLAWLDKHFGGKYNMVPMNLLKDANGEPVLHLDTVFNPLSENQALLYPKGLSRKAQNQITDNFNVTEITGDEQLHLGTNVFSLGNNRVVSQVKHKRINDELIKKGFNVSAINFGDTFGLTGAFRCTASPLVREQG